MPTCQICSNSWAMTASEEVSWCRNPATQSLKCRTISILQKHQGSYCLRDYCRLWWSNTSFQWNKEHLTDCVNTNQSSLWKSTGESFLLETNKTQSVSPKVPRAEYLTKFCCEFGLLSLVYSLWENKSDLTPINFKSKRMFVITDALRWEHDEKDEWKSNAGE